MKVMTLDVITANEIRYLIDKGEYKEGDKLPGERTLSEQFGVQRLTLRSGLRMLEDEGVIYSIPKKGYFVAKPRIEKHISQITSLFSNMQFSASNYRTRLIKFEEIEIDKYVSSETNLPLGTRIYEIKRLRIVDDEPISVDYSFVPKNVAPGLERYDFEKYFLYDIFKLVYNIELKKSRQEITVFEAEGNYRDLLNLPAGAKIILQSGRVYDAQNRLVEFNESYMKPNRFVYIT